MVRLIMRFLLFGLLLIFCRMEATMALLDEEDSSVDTERNNNNQSSCYDYDFFSNALDRDATTYNETDFGAVANVPFYDVATNETLGRIQFVQFTLPPGDCYMTTGMLSFSNSTNQLTYMFTTCNEGSSNDIITGGAGDFVGAYGKNSLVEFAMPKVYFKLEFCTPTQ